MATPPVFIADNEAGAGWDTSSPSTMTTGNFNSAIGDVWVTAGIAEAEGATFSTPTNTGTAQAFTTRGFVDSTDYSEVRTYTTVVANTLTTQSVSQVYSSTGLKHGLSVARFSGSNGIGAVPAGEAETAGTASSLSITTTGDNSAIVVFIGDWSASDGTSRTWRTVNSITPTAGNGFELTYFRNASAYTVYIAYYPDAGAAGAKTVGLTTPNMKAAIVAVEVLGTPSAAAALPILVMGPRTY